MQHTPTRPPASPPPAAGHAPLLMALLVFVITLLVTWVAWSSAQRSAEAQLREAFDYRTRAMTYNISRRMLVYEQVLQSARGFLRGSVDLPRAVFGEYYQSLDLVQNFPGIGALGIATRLAPGEVAAHEAQVRADGFPDYRVQPAPGDPASGPLLAAVSHIEPFNARNLRAFGFDMASEPARRAALLAARDSGHATLSGKVVLVQEDDGSAESGVLMYLPVYRTGRLIDDAAQRRAALTGWIYAPFRMNDLMRRVGGVSAPELDVTIHDGDTLTPATLLYQSAGAAAHTAPRFSATTRMMIAGRVWTVRMGSGVDFEAALDTTRPRMIAIAGIVLGALASLIVWLLASSRRRALELAHAMTLELRESHDRIAADGRRTRVILETAYDGFVALDREGRVTDWNAQASQIFGMEADDAIGRPAEELLPAEGHAAFRNAFDAFARSGVGPLPGQPAETEVLHTSGRRVPVELAVALLPPSDGAGATVFVRDITSRRAAEERELQRQARLVEARMALHRAQKLEAVGKLTGGVAHDFNNILHIISANVQLMLRADGPPTRKRLHNVLDAVERGSKLAGQLLAFARRQPLHPSVVNVAELLDRSDSLLQRAASDAVKLERSSAPDLWPTLVDPNQLEHVLLNLIINARDAMEGGGHIALRLANVTIDAAAGQLDPELTPGDYVMITVADTGHGMPPEVMEHAFEPFFTTKPEGKGTGLGLSMAHGFVRQSGGQIRLASKPDAGTTVTIYLPRHTAHVLPALAVPDVEALP